MGVIQFWDALRKEGLVKHLSAEKGDDRVIAENVDGRVLAVDLSVWLLQAGLQQDRQLHFSPIQSALKLCFERIINWLRYGCIPVAVLEGKSPPEKLELLQKRFKDRYPDSGGYQGNGGNASFQAFCCKIAGVFKAMGLPVVQAPGEAEAMCAALNAAGLVQGVATKDSDALLMGANTVFHTVELHTRSAKKCELAYCDVADVRKHLGLSCGGGAALLTLAELMGGDYHVGGAAKVGPVAAWGVVHQLLKEKEDDSDILDRLQAALKEDIREEDIPDKCTGCKRCGHDSNHKTSTKKHSKKNPCSCCQFSPEDLNGGFFCCQKDASAPCQCRFHTCKLERNLAKVLKRAKETPGFVRKAEEALQAYRNQMAEAAKAVLQLKGRREQLTWLHRPSPTRVHAVLSQNGGSQGLEWSRRDVERKLRPLLRTWDVQHPGQEGVEYRPVKIQKLHGAKGFEASGREWAYLLEWSKNGQADLEDDDEDGADDEEGEPKDAAERASGSAASGKVKKFAAGTNWARFVRMSVVQEHWRPLVKQFDAAVQQFKAKKSKQLAARDAKQAKKAGVVRLEAGQTTMHRFMQSKKLLDSGAAPASAGASTSMKAAEAPERQQGAGLGPGCPEAGRPTQGSRPRETAEVIYRCGPLSGNSSSGEDFKRGAEAQAAGGCGRRGLEGAPSGSRQGVQSGKMRADADRGTVPDMCSEAHILSNLKPQDGADVARPAEGTEGLAQRRRADMEHDHRSSCLNRLMPQIDGSDDAPQRSVDDGAENDSGGYGAVWDSEDAYCGISPMASPSPEPVEDPTSPRLVTSLELQQTSPHSFSLELSEDEQFHTPRDNVAEEAGACSPGQGPATGSVPFSTAQQLQSPKRARTPESPSWQRREAQASPAGSLSGEGGASPAKRPREPVRGASRPLAMRALSGPAPPETPARGSNMLHRSQPAVSLGEEEPVELQQAATACTQTSSPGPDKSSSRGAGSQLQPASRPARCRSRSGTSLSDIVEANPQGGRRSQRQAVPTRGVRVQPGDALLDHLVEAERAAHGSGTAGWQNAGASAEVKPIVTPLPQQKRGNLDAGGSPVVISLASSPETVDLTQDSPPIDLSRF